MTLHKQLLLFIFSLLIILFSGMWWEKFDSTRDYLLIQMESHAQDTATSLGLSLTTFMNELDVAAMETMVNVVFDRGYYQEITIENLEGDVVVTRDQEIRIINVPVWFVDLVPLIPPKADALIMNGWNQAGKITVTSHPGYAYATLWRSTVSTALWFVLSAVGATVIGTLGLRVLLKPLGKVESQALKLCNREYQLQKSIPRTKELKRVVVAMNRMTEKVQQTFFEQSAIADSLLQQNFQDALTGLGNRRYLEGQVLSQVTEKESRVGGAFLLVQCSELSEVNLQQGYDEGDELLKSVAAVIQKKSSPLAGVVGRLGGGDFAILLPNVDEDVAAQLLVQILLDANKAAVGLESGQPFTIRGGGALYRGNLSFSQLLAGADEALRRAAGGITETNGLSLIGESADDNNLTAKGKIEWKKTLEEVLENQSVELFYQRVVQSRQLDEALHFEILTRIKEDSGKFLPAGLFIPVAEQYRLIQHLDKLVITKVLEQLPDIFVPPRIAINLSAQALADQHFYKWLSDTIGRLPADGPKFNFEFPEMTLLQDLNLVRKFSGEVRGLGHYIGVDHFARGLRNFGYLQSLMPDYVKIDRAITRGLQSAEDDTCFFIRSLCNVAHSLDILVVVEGIETQQQLEAIQSTAVDGVQGFEIHRPEIYR